MPYLYNLSVFLPPCILRIVYKKDLWNNHNLKINFVAEEIETLPEEAEIGTEIENETNEAVETQYRRWVAK